MAMLAWIMTGLALWHFTVFVPDKFWGGIVGAFLGALVGSALFGFLLHGLTVPGRNDTELLTALEAIPGACIGMGIVYLIGARKEQAADEQDAAAKPLTI